ncbi:nucleoside hydrolase-like domain-containing protein [Novipirellula artificiosorum]|nr:nucleoside hydrolase-like domain-containing protein [Novipirellula artificiosorum]
MNRMHNQCLYAAVLLTMVNSPVVAQDNEPKQNGENDKPRIIVTTDLGADPDDEQSMVRLLVSANEFDIEGLIVSTGCWKKTQTDTQMLDKLVDAYGKCVGNLSVHATGFPSVDYLKSISVMGQKNFGMSDVGDGKDSPGSDLIITSVDKDDPRPVWVGAWGGANNAAQAIWKVRAKRSTDELSKFLSKLRVFDILGQDDAGAWIAKNFPEVLYIRATGVYGWQPPKNGDYQRSDIQSHGPLGAVYPDTKWATEGDTPAFMHVYPNGLNDPDQIDQGGWGGRFDLTKKSGIRSMKPVTNEGEFDPYFMFGNSAEGASAIKRWSTGYDNDFAARMDWSITSKYEDANHHPVAVVNGDTSRQVLHVSAAPGSMVDLSAVGSSDPDEDSLNYLWTFYQEPSSFKDDVEIQDNSSAAAKVMIPSNAGGKSLHIILELHDDGKPNLYAYRRVIIHVK